MQQEESKKLGPELKFAFLQTVPVLVGYAFLGMAFGLMLQNAGYHAGWAFLASLTIYAGSMQFVLVSILSTGLGLPTVALMTLSINSRHFFYGLPFLEKFRQMGKSFLYMVFSLTDETYALLCNLKVPVGLSRSRTRFMIALLNHSYWIVGSVLGAALGELVSFDLKGIEFTMTALFTVILVEQWQASKKAGRYSILIGAGCAVLALVIFGPGRFVLAALLLVSALLILLRPVLLRQLEHG